MMSPNIRQWSANLEGYEFYVILSEESRIQSFLFRYNDTTKYCLIKSFR